MLEMRTGEMTVDHVARGRASWDSRVQIISDSQVAVAAYSNGRPSRPLINRLCREVGAVALDTGIKFVWRYIRTDRDVADGPSRDQDLGVTCHLKNLLNSEEEVF